MRSGQTARKFWFVDGVAGKTPNITPTKQNNTKHNYSLVAYMPDSASISSLPRQADRKLLMEAGLACLVCPRARTGCC